MPALVDDLAVGPERRRETMDGIVAGGLDGGRNLGGERVEDPDDDRQEQVVLAAEVAVDQPHAHSGLRGDGLHRHRVRAIPLHQPGRGIEQLGAAVLGARLSRGRCGIETSGGRHGASPTGQM